MTVNHDAVGSSPTGGAIQALQSQCFFVAQNTLTLNFEVGGKACDAPSVAEEAKRVWRSGRLFARIRAEKDGNRKWKRDC